MFVETCKAVEGADSDSVGREGSVMPVKNSVFKLDMVHDHGVPSTRCCNAGLNCWPMAKT